MAYLTVAESGQFRRGEEGVFAGDQCIFMAPPAMRVPALMEDLFSWMKRASEEVHPLILPRFFIMSLYLSIRSRMEMGDGPSLANKPALLVESSIPVLADRKPYPCVSVRIL